MRFRFNRQLSGLSRLNRPAKPGFEGGRLKFPARILLSVVLFLMLGCLPTYAATMNWICGAGSQSWFCPTCWQCVGSAQDCGSQPRIPRIGDDVYLQCSPSMTVTVASPTQWAQANTLDNGQTLALSAAGTLSIGSINNRGTLIWEGQLSSGVTNPGLIRLPGNVNRATGSVITSTGNIIQEGGGLHLDGGILRSRGTYEIQAGTVTSFRNGTLVNSGTFRKTGTNAATMTSVFVNSSGPIDVQAGTLTIDGRGYVDAIHTSTAYSVAAGANLVFRGQQYFQGTHSGRMDGSLRFEEVSNAEGYGTGATFNFTGTGLQWVSGQTDGQITNVGLMTITGSGPHWQAGTLTNTGTIVHALGNVTVRNFLNNGLYEIQAGTMDTFSNGLFRNSSTLRKTTANPATLMSGFLNTGGRVDVQAGTLNINGRSFSGGGVHTTGGVYAVAAGSELVYRNQHFFAGTHSGQIDGTFRLESGDWIGYDTGATFNFTGAGLQWAGGSLSGGLSSPVTNAGLLRLVGSGDRGSTQTTNTGTIIQEGGSLTLSYFYNNALYDVRAGNIGAYTNGTLYNRGTLRKSGDGVMIFDPYLDNTGTIEVWAGTLQARSPVTQVSNRVLTGGSWTIFDGATLDIVPGESIETNNATVELDGPDARFPKIDSLRSNTGRFLVGAGRTFTTQAAFSNSGFLSIDVGSQLNVTGNFTQTSAGTLELFFGGLDPSLFGRIAATGDASLEGDLSPMTTEDFTPSEGDEFVVLRYNTLLSGRQFGSCSSCSIDELLTFTPVYELVQTKLVVNQQQ